MSRYRFIHLLCRVLRVSRAGYYAWTDDRNSATEVRRRCLRVAGLGRVTARPG